MSPKSIDLGDEAITSLFPKTFIKSQFLTKTRLPPPGSDLSGQAAIITGGNSGLGFFSAQHLLSLKLSHLIIAVRTPSKGESAAAKLRAQNPSAKVDVWPLEMTSYASLQAFVQRVEKDLPRLDITILNAGLMKVKLETCASTGHEETIQALSPRPGRLTIVSSGTALIAKFPNRNKRPLLASFDSTGPKGVAWDPAERYFVSKMLGHLFFVRLIDYLHSEDVIVNLVEPGLCKSSDLHRDLTGPIGWILSAYKSITGRQPEDGAWTYVDAAVVKGAESHGCFLMDWEIHPFTKLVYQPEGKAVMDALWDETIAEYESAGIDVREILERSKAGNL